VCDIPFLSYLFHLFNFPNFANDWIVVFDAVL
jgi:hypothetical protein